MKTLDFVLETLGQVDHQTQLSLAGMTTEQLLWRPAPEANSMAWLAWHIGRMQDVRSSHFMGLDQLWVADGWHSRFGLPPDPLNNGMGHNDDDVDAVAPESTEALAGYCSAAYERTRDWVGSFQPGGEELSVAGPTGENTTIATVLNRTVHGGLTHVGQLMYVRGLIERRHWFSR